MLYFNYISLSFTFTGVGWHRVTLSEIHLLSLIDLKSKYSMDQGLIGWMRYPFLMNPPWTVTHRRLPGQFHLVPTVEESNNQWIGFILAAEKNMLALLISEVSLKVIQWGFLWLGQVWTWSAAKKGAHQTQPQVSHSSLAGGRPECLIR